MNILLIGSGGREHALAYKIAESSKCDKLYIAPGNPGTANLGENININIADFEQFKDFILNKNVDILIVGPEAPLVDGLKNKVDECNELQHLVFVGPDAKGAQLEGSKDFAKNFMTKYNIPTAKHQTFVDYDSAAAYLDETQAPYVLKADGLAAGKGVIIESDKAKARAELKEMFAGKFGRAGDKVVIEQFLKGIELSVFVLTDGENYKILPEAKDYKRIGEGDTGLNTGGMGAISPVPFAGKDFLTKVEERIVKPTVLGLKQEGIDYQGFLFIGLMNVGGEPYVIEYNVRMGDPETEVVFPRITSDVMELFAAVKDKSLNKVSLSLDSRYACTVMMVSGGYPESYEKGKIITGTENVSDSILFHAGTSIKGNELVTSGGRVMAVTSLHEDLQKALELSFKNVEKVSFEKKFYRTDIGKDLLSF